MECKFTVYCDTAKATNIKIHKVDCPDHKKFEGHDHEWFYAPTYPNAKIIAELLTKFHDMDFNDCKHCNPQAN